MQIAHYVSDRRKKQKKRRLYFFAVAALLVVYFIFFGIFELIVRSPAFQAEKITVQGNSAVSQADILSLAEASVIRRNDLISQPNSGTKAMLGYKNLLIWPSALPSSTVAVIPQLASVAISKDYFLHTITITVTERQPFGIWCLDGVGDGASAGGTADAAAANLSNATGTNASDGGAIGTFGDESCFWFDNSGTVFEKALDTQGGAIVVVHDYSQASTGGMLTIGGSVLPAEFMPEFISILNVLQQSGVAIQQIALNDISLQEIDVATVDGPVLKFSLQFSAGEDLPVLENLMAQPGFDRLQYIDFTVQNRAFYK